MAKGLDINYAYLQAGRFAKAAVLIVDSARGVLNISATGEPSALLPMLVIDNGRFYCFFDIYHKKINKDLINPYVTNAAFSLELYLKVLLYRETGKWTDGHKLYDLFHSLSSLSQDCIRKDFAAAMSAVPRYAEIREQIRNETSLKKFDWNLDTLLANSSNAFVDWRYAFEKKPGWFAGFWELKCALVHRIEQLPPMPS